MLRDNSASVLAKFTEHLNCATPYRTIYNELLMHPEHPSLLAISDVLMTLKVPNKAFKIDDSDLGNISCPFIAHTTNKGNFIVVEKVGYKDVVISDDKKNNQKIS